MPIDPSAVYKAPAKKSVVPNKVQANVTVPPKPAAPQLIGQVSPNKSVTDAQTATKAVTPVVAAPSPTTGATSGGRGSGDSGSYLDPVPPGKGVQAPDFAKGAGAQASPAVTGESGGNDAVDQMIRDLVFKNVGGANNVDTSAEEALINQQINDKLGASLVDARAAGGRAGFGASGAQMAIEGDLRRSASQQALDDILGIRRSEDQRAQDNAFKAIGAETDMRQQASDEAVRKMALAALQQQMGLDSGGDGAGGTPDPQGLGVPDMNGDGVINQLDKLEYDKQRQGDNVDENGVVHPKGWVWWDPTTWKI